MFAPQFFAPQFFAPQFWPPGTGDTPVVVKGKGGIAREQSRRRRQKDRQEREMDLALQELKVEREQAASSGRILVKRRTRGGKMRTAPVKNFNAALARIDAAIADREKTIYTARRKRQSERDLRRIMLLI